MLLQYIPLSTKDKTRIFNIMKKGNPKLATHAERLYGKRKRRFFRKKLFNGEIDIKEVCIPQQDYDDIMAVREIELDVLQGYVPLCHKFATSWYNMSHHITGGTKDDYRSEAVLAMMDAVYGFVGRKKSGDKDDKKDIRFITYVCHLLKNHFIQFVSSTCPLSGLSNQHFINAVDFERERSQKPDLTYDEIVELAGFNSREILAIQSCFKLFVNESQIHSDYKDQEGGFDYTSLRQLSKENSVAEEFNVQSILGKIKMSPLEKDIIPHILTPGWGWQVELATKHNCSRQNVSQVTIRLKRKLAPFMEFGEFAAK